MPFGLQVKPEKGSSALHLLRDENKQCHGRLERRMICFSGLAEGHVFVGDGGNHHRTSVVLAIWELNVIALNRSQRLVPIEDFEVGGSAGVGLARILWINVGSKSAVW